MRIVAGTLIGLTLAVGLGIQLPDTPADPLESMLKPQYDDGGLLTLPQGYREWVFVGATLGPTNLDGNPGPEPGFFHHIYVQPEAYRHYHAHGEFPEKTIFVMENHLPAPKEGFTLQGYMEHELLGVEAAVKDHDRFSQGWAYYDFTNYIGRVNDRALAQWFCFNCHNTNGGDDNVFVQFYPSLRDVKNIEPEVHPDYDLKHHRFRTSGE